MGLWAKKKRTEIGRPGDPGTERNRAAMEIMRSARPRHIVTLTGERWRIGTTAECEIRFDPIKDEGVLPVHATIALEESRFAVVPTAEASTWINGKRLRKKYYLREGDEIAFGQVDGPGLRFTHAQTHHAGESNRPSLIVRIAKGQPKRSVTRIDRDVTIGRADHCDIQFDDPLVSSTHAEIAWQDNSWWLRDLQSTNGIYVDGARVEQMPIQDHVRVELALNGPALHLEVAEVQRTKTPGEMPLSLTRIAQRYFGEGSGGAAGRQTMMIREAFQRVQTKQKKRYGWIIGIIGALLVVAAIALYVQHLRVKKLEEVHLLAENMFYTMKNLELQIASLQSLVEQHGDAAQRVSVAEKLKQQKELQDGYNVFAGEAGISSEKLSEDEWLIYKVARLFGECDVSMPRDFVGKVKEYIRRWQTTSLLEESVERARRLGYSPKIAEHMLSQNLPPQFFYLALQESAFDVYSCGPMTRSGVAKGMWQFVPQTALAYGLHTGPLVELRRPDPRDERHDFDKSTKAAAKYLRFLYETEAQASGLLVMASYNWGEDRVEPLIRSMPKNPRERNFWKLLEKYKIPNQTYDYVFSIFSAAVIGENPRLFGFHFDNPLGEE
jgi:membrane-bound lytic murein transglycosylase D